MNVLLYSSVFPTPLDPNHGIFTAQLARALAARVALEVLCPVPWCPDLPWFRRHPRWRLMLDVPERGQWGGVTVHYAKYPLVPKIAGALHPLLQACGVWQRLRRLDRRRYDVIHAHWLYPDGVAAVLLGRWLKLPVVLTALGSDVNMYGGYRLRRPQLRWAIRRARSVTAVSKALVQRLAELGGDPTRLCYIPNGIDSQRFSPLEPEARAALRRRLGLDPATRYLLFVGRLHPVKGLAVLIEALSVLHAGKELSFDTLIVGDGDERAALARLAAARGVGHRVQFVGERAHAEVAQWLQSADVLCLPSLMEGMPNVVLEALACGVPVVASRVGAIPDLVGPQSGILVEPGAVDPLARALADAFRRSWQREQIAPPDMVKGWEAVAEQYLSVLDGASKNNSEPCMQS